MLFFWICYKLVIHWCNGYWFAANFKSHVTKIMASGPITSWQIYRETMETVRDFILGGSKSTVDGDFSYEIKRPCYLEEKLLLLLSRFSYVRLCATPETAAHTAPPTLGFSRQEHWSGLPFPSPGRKAITNLDSKLKKTHYFTSMWDKCNCVVVWAFFGTQLSL